MTDQGPIGKTAAEGSRRRSHNPEYRAEFERIQPFEDVAAKVIRLRMDQGLTQQELADRTGTTKSAISRLESGQHAPNYATLQKIAAAFGGRAVVDFDIPEHTGPKAKVLTPA